MSAKYEFDDSDSEVLNTTKILLKKIADAENEHYRAVDSASASSSKLFVLPRAT